MNLIILFLATLFCLLVGDLLTGLMITLLYKADPYKDFVNVDQTFMFFVITAGLITIVITLINKRNTKNPPKKI